MDTPDRMAGPPETTLEDATAELYRADNAPLYPLHEALVEMTHALGEDVWARPQNGFVALLRRTLFLALAPATPGELHIGLHYPHEVPQDERLRLSGEFGRPLHVLAVPADALDADLISLEPLIAAAYEQNG